MKATADAKAVTETPKEVDHKVQTEQQQTAQVEQIHAADAAQVAQIQAAGAALSLVAQPTITFAPDRFHRPFMF
jgi:hypothetical protein